MIELLSKPVHTIHDTEPELASVGQGNSERCGVENCDKPAYPLAYCRWCHVPLCFSHSKSVLTIRGVATFCPEHEKGAS